MSVSAENFQPFVPTTSVVICTHNRPAQLEKCLEAVSRLNYPHFEVVVVDSAPTDDGARRVAARWDVIYVVEPMPGASRARNRGARACTSEVVAFLDDDAVPEAEWLSCLTGEFEDPCVMAVGGRIVGLSIETRAERFFDGIGGFDCGPERRVVDQGTPRWFELANFGGLGNGNLAIRRCAFDSWRGFHECLGPGTPLVMGEEHHALFSLIARGYRVVYAPDAVIKHPYPGTIEELRLRLSRRLLTFTGYITLLVIEEPKYRWPALKYVLEGLCGLRRRWRWHPPISQYKVLSFPQRLVAFLQGPICYARVRLTPVKHMAPAERMVRAERGSRIAGSSFPARLNCLCLLRLVRAPSARTSLFK